MNPDAIVIGGGFAGLAAATALAGAGARVLVVEARPQLGGRATAYRDPKTGERIDNGQHVLAGCYDETLRFLRRIGSERALRRPSTLKVAMIDEAGTRHELTLPPLPSPLHLLAGVLAWRDLTWRERLAVLRIGPVLRRLAQQPPRKRGSAEAGAETMRETVREWLDRHGQPPRLCRLFWEPLALATLNQSIDHAAAGPFVTVISRMLGSDAAAATLLLPATMLDELYVKPAAAFLTTRGSRIQAGKPARIHLDADNRKRVVFGDTTVESRVVISAVPWYALADVLPAPPPILASLIANATAFASSPIVTVNVWFDRPVLKDDFLGLPGRAFQWVFDKQRIIGHGLSHLSLVSSGAEAIVALDNDTLSRRALDELRAAIPEARRATVRHLSIVRERRATFSLSPAMPARPKTQTPVEGFLLAGDWIDTGLPATIESAVASGHGAAAAALDLLRH